MKLPCPEHLWPAFSALLDDALELEAERREAWLASLPAEHAALRPFLIEALEADRALEARPAADRPRLEGEACYVFEAGQRIGPYRLREPLGTGGMGEVWVADRDDGAVKREVALKLPHVWLLGVASRMRLGREGDFLASLNHPHIAQLYDAGIDTGGQPWLALERVAGVPIDAYCRERGLFVAARLQLFMQVLAAVSAAHAQLIVHRDLKPSNLLVTADGTVKLLDFGIAKLVEGPAGEVADVTRIGGRVATPEYAAPEQFLGGAITVGTDVYSLGAVLYELLCGKRPFARATDGRRDVPPPASSRVQPEHAARCGSTVPLLARALRGDLDAILTRALMPEPARRYPSVQAFADDLARHLSYQPVLARPLSRRERVGKFVRRHRAGVAVATALVATVTAATAVSLQFAFDATREARRAEAANAFLLKVVTSAEREKASDRAPGSITAREMLDDLVANLDERLHDQPEVQVSLLKAAELAYDTWGAMDESIAVNQRYVQILERLHEPEDPILLQALHSRAGAHVAKNDMAAAALIANETGRRIRAARLYNTIAHADWLDTTASIAWPAVGMTPEVIDKLRSALAITLKIDDKGYRTTYQRRHLAVALEADGQFEAARAQIRESVRKFRLGTPDSDVYYKGHLTHLGDFERQLGDAKAAEAAYREAYELNVRLHDEFADEHYKNAMWLATFAAWQGRHDEAERAFRERLVRIERAGPAQSENYTAAWHRLHYGRFLLERGRAAEALPLLEKAASRDLRIYQAPIQQPEAIMSHAEALEALGRIDAARTQFRRARDAFVAMAEASGAPGWPATLDVRERWARFELEHGEAGAAAAAERELHAVLKLAAERPIPARANARMALAVLESRRGQRDAAQGLARQAVAEIKQVRAMQSPQVMQRLQSLLARIEQVP